MGYVAATNMTGGRHLLPLPVLTLPFTWHAGVTDIHDVHKG